MLSGKDSSNSEVSQSLKANEIATQAFKILTKGVLTQGGRFYIID